MKLTINGCDFKILGDPHRGRPFRNGVPLHRLGDREKMQSSTMKESLKEGADGGYVAHICMGDLFDKPKVSNEIVSEVADEYTTFVGRNADMDWVCLPGNHDISRDTDVVSSFELFARIMDGRMIIPQREPVLRYYADPDGDQTVQAVFIPWHPTKTAAEVVEDAALLIKGADVVFGHWDVDRRLEGTDNYIPAARLKELGVGQAVTGHDHVQRQMVLSGLDVIVTGSMQPYSHSEDPEGTLYMTVAADEARRRLECGPEFFRDVCLRVVGEWDDEIPDCLQFKVVADETELKADEALATVQIAEFSMADLWSRALADIDPEINAELKAKFAEIGGENE